MVYGFFDLAGFQQGFSGGLLLGMTAGMVAWGTLKVFKLFSSISGG